MKIFLFGLSLCLGLGLYLCPDSSAQDSKPIILPRPNTEAGKPLMAAINERHTDRNFKAEALSDQQTAEILWVAVGVNRPDKGNLRTTPTAMNRQDVSVYALSEKGAFYYDALEHSLDIIAQGDQTSILGAPFGLVFVAPVDNSFAGVNVGYCSQNVYLYAASEGLNTVAKGTFDKDVLKKLLKLKNNQQIVLVQPIGPRP